ncbi:DUF192 domain-containing protein [Hoeflea sp. G2-23]|uniref:DUF192 domain-containing protein n=1 Tax=Hoeflea algicola TaxID=2983763 RepID=A0ABT3Z5L3_9HYPH|nr:DUF192 domain-containing protein [Hoeflea algicola]MCY0147047.1 DUF192 domain-containing protein [Hoeflea algicola]
MRRFPNLTDILPRAAIRLARMLCAALMLAVGVATLALALPTDSEKLVIVTSTGPVEFTVELALTPADRSTGLMNRETMASNHGMLFRFEETRQVLMWMKNTPLPLDMLFLDEQGAVVGIAADTTPFSEAIIPSPGPVKYVLELNAGAAGKAGISVGDMVRHRVIGN